MQNLKHFDTNHTLSSNYKIRSGSSFDNRRESLPLEGLTTGSSTRRRGDTSCQVARLRVLLMLVLPRTSMIHVYAMRRKYRGMGLQMVVASRIRKRSTATLTYKEVQNSPQSLAQEKLFFTHLRHIHMHPQTP